MPSSLRESLRRGIACQRTSLSVDSKGRKSILASVYNRVGVGKGARWSLKNLLSPIYGSVFFCLFFWSFLQKGSFLAGRGKLFWSLAKLTKDLFPRYKWTPFIYSLLFSQPTPPAEADNDPWAFPVVTTTPFPAAWREDRVIVGSKRWVWVRKRELFPLFPALLLSFSFPHILLPSPFLLPPADSSQGHTNFHFSLHPQKFRGPEGMLRKGCSLAQPLHCLFRWEVISFQKVWEIDFQQEGTKPFL